MRKLAFFSVLVMISVWGLESGYAGCNTPVRLSYEGLQSPSDDEFLYDNVQQYELARAGYKNTGSKNSGAGVGYECDEFNTGGCELEDVIEMRPGHVFQGEQINQKRRYQCNATWGADRWSIVQDGFCDTKGFGKIEVGKSIQGLRAVDCSGYELSDQNGIEFEGVCSDGPRFICKVTKCIEGMVANNGKCEILAKEKTTDTQKTPVKPINAGGDSSVLQKCLNSRQSAEGKACCYVSASIANWNGTSCACTDASKKFDIISLQCLATAAAVVATPGIYQCDAVTLAWIRQIQVQYNSDAAISTLIREIIEFCANDANRTQARFEDMITQLRILINNNDQANANARNTARQLAYTTSTTTIKSSLSTINNMVESFDVTVWKNAEGKFNTSRLVSDSVAGVVLGTAGGLITSSVVKKNQVKSGFEDISCTIGGQVVAGWGDEFNVGIR